jgi:hypothetical protein
MARTDRLSTTAAVIACFVLILSAGATLFASEEESSPRAAASAPLAVNSPFERDGQPVRLRFSLDDGIFTTPAPLEGRAPAWQRTLTLSPAESGAFAQRGRFWGRGGRNQGARTALVLGTLATITGAALLVYANRPECGTNETAYACGYGTKVVGGAVLSAGLVGIVAGTVSWR